MILLFLPLFLFALTIQNISNREFNITKYEHIKILNSKNIKINFVKKFRGNIDLLKFITIKNSQNIYISNLYIESNNFYNAKVKIKLLKNKKITLIPINGKEKHNFLTNIKKISKQKTIYLSLLKNNRISRKFLKLIFLNNYTFKYVKKFPFKDFNSTYLLNFRYKYAVFNIINSKNIYIKNIILNTSPNIVFLLKNDENLYFNNIKIKDTTKRGITSNADIFHCPDIKGDFILKNSYFEYVSDDIINVYTKALKIKCKRGKCILNKKYQLQKGERLLFYNIKNADLFKASIKDVKKNSVIFLNKPFSTDKDIQVYRKNIVNILIENNVFKNSRRFGVLIRNYGNSIIRNNIFENLDGDAITFFNSPVNEEGLFSKNILIKNNIIKNCAMSENSRAAISVYALKDNWKLVDYKKIFFKNIHIFNNKIKCKKCFFIRNGVYININN